MFSDSNYPHLFAHCHQKLWKRDIVCKYVLFLQSYFVDIYQLSGQFIIKKSLPGYTHNSFFVTQYASYINWLDVNILNDITYSLIMKWHASCYSNQHCPLCNASKLHHQIT